MHMVFIICTSINDLKASYSHTFENIFSTKINLSLSFIPQELPEAPFRPCIPPILAEARGIANSATGHFWFYLLFEELAQIDGIFTHSVP